jgi:hypothetical protein
MQLRIYDTSMLYVRWNEEQAHIVIKCLSLMAADDF